MTINRNDSRRVLIIFFIPRIEIAIQEKCKSPDETTSKNERKVQKYPRPFQRRKDGWDEICMCVFVCDRDKKVLQRRLTKGRGNAHLDRTRNRLRGRPY